MRLRLSSARAEFPRSCLRERIPDEARLATSVGISISQSRATGPRRVRQLPLLVTIGMTAGLLFACGCQVHPSAGPPVTSHSPVSGQPSQDIEYYVAPYGSDLDPGTQQRPFATLEGARDAIRALRAAGEPFRPVTVWIRGGMYFCDRGLELTQQDSGAPGAPIVYRACGRLPVRLIGGLELMPSWCRPVEDATTLERLPEEARDNVLRVDLRRHGLEDYGEMSMQGPMLELFCNGKRLPVARWPNEGWAHIGKVVETREDGTQRLVDGNKRGRTFQCLGDRPRRWLRAEQAVLHGFWWYGWTDQHVAIERIDPKRGLITLTDVPGGGIRRNQWFCALNLLEELDAPGEWFLDRETGVLYLWPPEDGSTHSILLSTLSEPLIQMSEASHVTIRGVTLEVTRGVATVISGGSYCRFAGCVIRCAGSHGAVVDSGRRNGLVGCDVYQVGATGVHITGGNRWTLAPSGNYVLNCHIHHYSQRKKVYQPAVRMYGVGHRIAHNLIHDAPHQAIAYDGNEHVIELNEIHHVVLDSADAGVMYSGCHWTFRGNVVRHNFIHHIPHGPGLGTVGIYLDDCACSTRIMGNVFFDMLKPTFIGGGRDSAIENNIFIECDVPVYLDNRGLRWGHFVPSGPMYAQLRRMRYDQPPWRERYPSCARMLDEIPQAPLGNVVARNVAYDCRWRDPELFCRRTSHSQLDRPYLGMVDNWITEDDPGFVDATTMDFRLRPDAEVFRRVPGFRPIPFGKIGLYRDAYRATWPVPEGRWSRSGDE